MNGTITAWSTCLFMHINIWTVYILKLLNDSKTLKKSLGQKRAWETQPSPGAAGCLGPASLVRTGRQWQCCPWELPQRFPPRQGSQAREVQRWSPLFPPTSSRVTHRWRVATQPGPGWPRTQAQSSLVMAVTAVGFTLSQPRIPGGSCRSQGRTAPTLLLHVLERTSGSNHCLWSDWMLIFMWSHSTYSTLKAITHSSNLKWKNGMRVKKKKKCMGFRWRHPICKGEKNVPFLTSRQMLDNHIFTAKQFHLH